MGSKLFDGSDGSEDDLSKIEINKEYACRYEHNKKREDLQRLEVLKKKGLIEDSLDSDNEASDESVEEDQLMNSSTQDLEFFNALLKVRNKDPVLRRKETKLFDSDDSESETESVSENDDDKDKDNAEQDFKKGKMFKKEKKKKPMYLKDVVSMHLIEEGPEFEDKDDKKLGGVKSYKEEQEELKKAFLDASKEVLDDEGEFLNEKESGGNKVEDGEDDEEMTKKLDEYFGDDMKLDENTMFLKDYFRNKMWVEDKSGKGLDEDGLGFSEDEEEIEHQEDYEREFNFRFEENVGDRVMGHSRFVEGSVRKTTNARKLQRERKELRMALAEFERKEELKHLKNLKKAEINEKLRKIRETAGIGDDGVCPLDEDELEEEWDPEEHDRKMKEAFDDEYYGADDVNPEFGSDNELSEFGKPDFDKEDELLGLRKGWDDAYGSGDGFLAARERNLKRGLDNGSEHGQINEEEEEEEVPEEGKRKKKRKMSSVEKAVRVELMDEYYKLEYEDTIGDLKTRFKYKPVNAKRYGLSTEEVLMMDDKELNQYVSLKKLVPYQEKEWKVARIKTYNQKQKNKALVRGGDTANVQKTAEATKIKKPRVEGLAVGITDMGNQSRKSRRRHRQAELKLSRSRLMAYGKIPSKAKKSKRN